MEEDPKARLDRFRLLFAASLLTLVLGYWVKVRCLHEPWGAGFEFRNYCYSDIYVHWWLYGFADGAWPYVTHWNEYPALGGTISWLISLGSDGVETWWRLHGFTLLVGALAVTWVLFKMGHDWRSAAPWVFAPNVVIAGFTNYDFWALGFLALGLLSHHQGRRWTTGVFLGLGAAAKLFPGFLWPPILVVLLNEARHQGIPLAAWAAWKAPAKVTGGFLLGLLPINLAYMLNDFGLWYETWRFQSDRGTTYETFYYLVDQKILQPYFDHAITASEMNAISALLFLGGSGLLLLAALRKGTRDAYLLGMAVLIIYLLTTKVYSSQHGLWILPFFVMARLPLWTWAAFSVADVIAINWFYHFFTPPQGQLEGRSFEFLPLVEFWVAVRLAVLVVILAYVVRRILRGQDPVGAAADDESPNESATAGLRHRQPATTSRETQAPDESNDQQTSSPRTSYPHGTKASASAATTTACSLPAS